MKNDQEGTYAYLFVCLCWVHERKNEKEQQPKDRGARREEKRRREKKLTGLLPSNHNHAFLSQPSFSHSL